MLQDDGFSREAHRGRRCAQGQLERTSGRQTNRRERIDGLERIAKKEDIELTDGKAAKGPPRRSAGARAESAAANLRRALEKAWKAKDRARVAALFANANAKVLLPKVLDEIRREKAHRAAAGGSSPSVGG